MTIYELTEKEILEIKKYFINQGFQIKSLKYLINYLKTHYYILSKEESIKDKYDIHRTEQIPEHLIENPFIDENYLEIGNDRYLSCMFVKKTIDKLIKQGFVVYNNKIYGNILEPSIEYIEEISEYFHVTAYISDSISDLKGGYYRINGKIFYDEHCENFDFYSVKAWTRKQAREYYSRIRH